MSVCIKIVRKSRRGGCPTTAHMEKTSAEIVFGINGVSNKKSIRIPQQYRKSSIRCLQKVQYLASLVTR